MLHSLFDKIKRRRIRIEKKNEASRRCEKRDESERRKKRRKGTLKDDLGRRTEKIT